MNRHEREDGSVEITTILSREAMQAVDVLVRITGASEQKIIDQLIIDASGFRADAALGTKIIIRRSDADYRVNLPIIQPDPGPNVVEFRRPHKATPNNSA